MSNIAILFSALGPELAPAAGDTAPALDAPPPDPVSPTGAALASRADNERVARLTAQALRQCGHHTWVVPVWDRVPVHRLGGVDGVLNLLEGLEGESHRESQAAQQLWDAKVPFSGSLPGTLWKCQRKELCKAVLTAAGVPVPAGVVLAHVPRAWPQELPRGVAMVKPAWEDASEGIDAGAVVGDLGALQGAVARVVEQMQQPAIVEQFIVGREITASLLGAPPKVLPLGEIDFSSMRHGAPHIVSYAAKWCPNSEEYQTTPSVGCHLDEATTRRIKELARTAAGALGLLDVARLDLRMDAMGRLYVIDVNPNCDLGPDAGFAKAGARAGLSYPELLDAVMARTLAHARQDAALYA